MPGPRREAFVVVRSTQFGRRPRETAATVWKVEVRRQEDRNVIFLRTIRYTGSLPFSDIMHTIELLASSMGGFFGDDKNIIIFKVRLR